MKNTIKLVQGLLFAFLLLTVITIESNYISAEEITNNISVNEIIIGNISDHRYENVYEFELTKDGMINIDFNHDYVDSTGEYWRIYVYNSDKQKIAQYGINGKTVKNKLSCLGLPAGIYSVKVSSNYFSDVNYNIKVNYTQSDSWETEFNESYDTANPLETNKIVYGSIRDGGSRDQDYYKFSLSNRGYINLAFEHNYIDSTYVYWRIYLFDSDMKQIDSFSSNGTEVKKNNHYIGLDKGDYYIKVGKDYFSSIQYGLKINYSKSNSWETEFNNTYDTPNLVQLNSYINGTITDGYDIDYYKINIKKTGYYDINMYHKYINSYNRAFVVSILNHDMKEIDSFSSDSMNKNTTKPWVKLKRGTYYLKVTGYNYTENYKMKISPSK